jgi:hypothetical protein
MADLTARYKTEFHALSVRTEVRFSEALGCHPSTNYEVSSFLHPKFDD